MLAERWQQIESIFHQALQKPAEERGRFLEESCSKDPGVRREVESLLANEELAATFLESGASEAPAARGPDLSGERVGPYTVMELLGSGGMGEVYKDYDTRLDRFVAIKFLTTGMDGSPSALERFQREARAASALNDPNICTVHDVGEFRGRPFLVMELLEGSSLKESIGKPLPADEVIRIARQVCAALRSAHNKGIVHRDIKPANIFIGHPGQVKVLDFGLAKYGAFTHSVVPDRCIDLSMDLTMAGTILGTLPYMSPEQLRGEPAEPASDLFSLAVTLYQMATGELPFRGNSAEELRTAILDDRPVRHGEGNPPLSPVMERVLFKGLEKEASARYRSASEMLAAFDTAQSAASPRRTWWGAGIAAIGASVLLVAAASRISWFATGTQRDLIPRQITANPPEDPIMQASISPDGQTVAYEDFGGIHLRRIATAETRVFAPAAGYCYR